MQLRHVNHNAKKMKNFDKDPSCFNVLSWQDKYQHENFYSRTFGSYGVFLKQNRNTYFNACFTQHTGFLFPQLGFWQRFALVTLNPWAAADFGTGVFFLTAITSSANGLRFGVRFPRFLFSIFNLVNIYINYKK